VSNKWSKVNVDTLETAQELARRLKQDPTEIKERDGLRYFRAGRAIIAQSISGGPVKQRLEKKRKRKRLQLKPKPYQPWVAGEWRSVKSDISFDAYLAKYRQQHGVEVLGEARTLYVQVAKDYVLEMRLFNGTLEHRSVVRTSSSIHNSREALKAANSHLRDKTSGGPSTSDPEHSDDC
jgi:hypothetical protein